MRSIPWVMSWAMLRRSPWGLVGALLGANLLPVFLLSALRSAGGVDPNDPAMIIIHVVLSQITAFVLAAALFGSQGPVSGLFCFPASTATIVTWRLLPAMALAAAAVGGSTLAINALYGMDWPVLGPALTVAAALALVQAAFWLTYETWWMFVGVGAAGALIGTWHKAQYGPLSAMPTHYWRTVTAADVAQLLGFAALAWAGAVIGVGRLRRGDRIPSLGLAAWFLGVADRGPLASRRFRSGEAAHDWCEWRRKGWVMPAIVLLYMTFGVFGWLLGDRDSRELVNGLIAGGGALTLLGLLGGLVFGVSGANGFPIGQFLATRPITSGRMAWSVLRALARSVLTAWLIWLVALLIALAALWTDGFDLRQVQPSLAWWHFPLTLIGPWIVSAPIASLCLAGSEKRFSQTICAVTGVLIAGLAYGTFALSDEARQVFQQLSAALVGVACLGGTAAVTVLARRRKLVDTPVLIAAACTWLLLTGGVLLATADLGAAWPMTILGSGLAALAVAPAAAAPLALSLNRTR
ncbi:MAG: hypothetical protein KF774_20750 [Planctomyces sp.]|nr:hypothetical protein [Planctomyces sp.]